MQEKGVTPRFLNKPESKRQKKAIMRRFGYWTRDQDQYCPSRAAKNPKKHQNPPVRWRKQSNGRGTHHI